jgi:hypothetical protein
MGHSYWSYRRTLMLRLRTQVNRSVSMAAIVLGLGKMRRLAQLAIGPAATQVRDQ